MKQAFWLYGGLVALLGAGGTSALAQDAPGVPGEYRETPNWYLGTNFSYTEYDDDDINEDWGYKVYGGYQFNSWLSGQIGYARLGDFASEIDSGDVEVDGFEAAAVGRWPFTDYLSAFGKVGAFAWDTSVDGPGINIEDDSGTDVSYGVGLEWMVDEQFGTRFEVERFADVGGEDIDAASLGVIMRF